ncbi:tubulin glycylase 3B-like isoform X4 [Dreissena polymorpha]|uniref:tubulin glycylase 3B-like isoform X4 n=1 Tax=Dreissena polymorpha TaxID=45954 RepID=UPI0022652C03|nr:tubulin glycylase 3B-like isoform X4 [Dreissena polymorpha]
MGKNKRDVVSDENFIPRISSTSRKLAAKRLEQTSLGGLPHFMREIKCKSTVPLAPIPLNENNKAETTASDTRAENSIRKVLQPITMTAKPLLDDSVFTFKPRVSSASAKIVENLGTDFMERQQQHLDKQKKMIERAGNGSYSGAGNLSPLSQYKRLKEKGFKIEESDNTNNNSSPPDQEAEIEGPDSPTDRSELEELADTMPALMRTRTSMSKNLQRVLDGPYANGNPDMVLKRHKTRIRAHHMKGNKSLGDNYDLDDLRDSTNTTIEEEEDIENGTSLSRSKTMPSLGRPKLSRKITSINTSTDRLAKAKDVAEKAIRNKKVFTIQGGYSAIRHSLRKRGWVEKFYRIPGPQKSTKKGHKKGGDDDDEDGDDDGDDDDDDDDDTDSDNDQPSVPPWEEEEGIYGIMSRIVRNVNPTFIWVLKRDVIDYRFLTKEQMVNHYCKAGSFTTKVGLCVNMRQVPWFDESDPDEFYPRCYRLSHEEEKAAFIDDYRLTTCVNILKIVISMYMEGGECNSEGVREKKQEQPEIDPEVYACTNPECTRSRPNEPSENLCVHALQKKKEEEEKQREKELIASELGLKKYAQDFYIYTVIRSLDSSRKQKANKKKRMVVPQQCLDRALIQCEKYLIFRNHDDIDQSVERDSLTPAQWDELITWYYQLVHEGGLISNVPSNILGQIENVLNRIKAVWPQYELDGVKNVWIVKPGAKSRGRGITCYDKLEDMLKLVSSQVIRKDNKYVVQKYMERPLLIHNCKFDIRQWFLVTDWNPLTIYFYMDSYLRFCSQQFTLESYDESIHLSNNAIQKHYKNGVRSKELPQENMWTHETFKEFTKKQGAGNVWDALIYPGMKKAIICSLLSTQDLVEYRKASFELYGADFMLTEDYKPWLIEINSSPSMESSTAVTSLLCANVLEDTLKVVLDRKWDKNCDIGRFELAYKQPLVTVPPYIGISLCAEGNVVKKPSWMNVRRQSENNEALFSPRKEKQVIFNDKLLGNRIDTGSKGVKRPKSENGHEDTSSYTKATTSAPLKKSTSRDNNQDSPGNLRPKKAATHKSPKIVENLQPTNSASNNSVTNEKSYSENGSMYSRAHSEQSKQDIDNQDDRKSERTAIVSSPPSPILAPKMAMFGSGTVPNASYISSLAQRKIVSKTSVSMNYTIPSQDNKERPQLTVSNVETTDLRTLRAQAKGTSGLAHKLFYIGQSYPHQGVYSLTDGTWARTCSDCGNGLNLHLDNINPFCKCRQDGIRLSPDPQEFKCQRAKSARNPPSRNHSRISPRPPSASGVTPRKSSSNLSDTSVISNEPASKNPVFLRYTDGGIMRPVTPLYYYGSRSLPRLVRRHIGRRVGQYHELSVGQNSAIFIDTSQLNGALSIISHGYSSK